MKCGEVIYRNPAELSPLPENPRRSQRHNCKSWLIVSRLTVSTSIDLWLLRIVMVSWLSLMEIKG